MIQGMRKTISSSTGIAKAGLNVIMSQSWIVFNDICLRPPIGQKVYYELNCQACAFDHRFSHQDFRVDGNSVLPIHEGIYMVKLYDISSA